MAEGGPSTTPGQGARTPGEAKPLPGTIKPILQSPRDRDAETMKINSSGRGQGIGERGV